MQGFNMGRYVPPDLEGTTSGNKLHGKHALGGRASKLASQGILTVRFEMPFAVWCNTCPKPTLIGQGVRFNAEKRRVGSYHSTPVLAFRMRHTACGGAIEIRTDPANTAYVVAEGGRKRDTGEDVPRDGDVVIMTDRERDALRANAFAKLERTIEDREQLAQARERLGELEDAQSQDWDDPYELNRRLRRTFRVGRHEREREGKAAAELQDRMSLGIDLVPMTEEDKRRAALVDFGAVGGTLAGDRALSRPLFEIDEPRPAISSDKGAKRLKSEAAASQMKESLVAEIVSNTRASQDPFLVQNSQRGPVRIPGIKRKRVESNDDTSSEKLAKGNSVTEKEEPIKRVSALVNYGSDSD